MAYLHDAKEIGETMGRLINKNPSRFLNIFFLFCGIIIVFLLYLLLN